MIYDFVVIGAGIVGLAAARAIMDRWPAARLAIIEKETRPGVHQSGHNSGVIHAGVYYAPGSLKAELCRKGATATKDFCRRHDIPFEECGKLIVATNPLELGRLADLEKRCIANGVGVRPIGAAELNEIEPRVSGLGALLVAETGIVDYKEICRAFSEEITRDGGIILLGSEARSIIEESDAVTVETTGQIVRGKHLVACAGLHSDRIASMAGLAISHRIVPFRGEYYKLPSHRSGLVRHLIYPVPDPDLPFLGVHLTRMIDGSITVGPNAVLAFSREGYRKGRFSLRDTKETFSFPGFWRVLAAHWRSGLDEFRGSLFRRHYLDLCRKYCPELTLGDLRSYPAGIRAQAVARDGTLIHDFLFIESSRMLHVCNAPSPAATSALPIGQMIVDRLAERLSITPCAR